MFSALRQGSIIYILEKGEKPILKIGQVASLTHPNYNNNNYLSTNSTVDIHVKVGNENMEFKNVPSSQTVTQYNNAIITETKELMSVEVENMLQASKGILNSVSYHEQAIEACEDILKELNPRFAKEKERDEDISNLKDITDNNYKDIYDIVNASTDNRNRTAGDLRHYFDKFGGNLGATGCVSWQFDQKGVIILEKEGKSFFA